MSVFTLYRFFDADDVLLYVGLTVNPGQRFLQHRAEKPWWIDVARIDLEQHDSLDALRYAERVAIETEDPVYNIAMNDRPEPVSNREKRRTLEGFGWRCISNVGSGTFVRPERPSAFYTRAAAWTQLQR